MEKAKKEYKSLITESKLKQQNSDSNFLNNSRDSGQFWHRYSKIIGRKSNNIVEPIFDNGSQTYIFDDEIISEKLNNDLKRSDFKAEIYLQERYHKNYKAKNRSLDGERAQKQN